MPDSGVINCAAYADGCRVAHVAVEDIQQAIQTDGQFVWIGLNEPDEALLRKVQAQLHLHDLAVEDALRAHQRPKLEEYSDSLFVVLRTAQLHESKVEFGETHIFVGRQWLVSVRHGASLSYAQVRARCESTPQLLSKGPGFVLYALMDFVVDQYFPLVDELEDSLEAIEEKIFDGGFDRSTTQQIYDLKRDLVALKRAVSPLVDVCNRLVRFDASFIPEPVRVYFRDVYDHVIRINEAVDNQRELLTTALEANLSMISIGQNDVTKKLASWAAILAVPTMIAGVYGMNFEFMPELHWSYGYPVIVGLMIGACGLLYRQFKKSGWL